MDKQLTFAYANDTTFLVWKLQGIASSWGIGLCLLDLIEQDGDHPGVDATDAITPSVLAFLDQGDWTPIVWDELKKLLKEQFTHDQEYGLLNRLDTPTGGFLTFAKDQQSKEWFLEKQKEGQIVKHYLATVSGNPTYLLEHPEKNNNEEITINPEKKQISVSHPLMHHRHLENSMIAMRGQGDVNKGRGKLLPGTTTVEVLEQYDSSALVECIITKGQRHQIRVHAAALGYPIVGDELYGREKTGRLELWCMGWKG